MAISLEAFSRLVSLAHAAPLDGRLWQKFLQETSAVAGGLATHIIGFDGQGREDGNIAHGYDPAALASYGAYYARLNAWSEGFLKRQVGETVSSREMCPDDELIPSEFYNDWVRPQEDIRRGGGVIVSRTPNRVFALGGNIPYRRGAEAENKWLSLCSRLLPHLTAAWRVAEAMTAARLGGGDLPLIVLRDDGVVAFANAEAEEMIETGGPGECGLSGRFGFADEADDGWLARRLSSVGAGIASDAPATRLICGRIVRTGAVNPDALAATWPVEMSALTGPGLVLTFVPAEGAKSPEDLLVDAFGLSPSEAAVAMSLVEGGTTREIAAERRVSLHTVRDQVRAAREKVGVNRQTQLVSKVLQVLNAPGDSVLRF